MAERRAAFVEAARDERCYGPAKLLSEHMRREGVDVTDKQAVDAAVRRFNERLADDPTLLPMLGGAGNGSGRRYRKCCMPVAACCRPAAAGDLSPKSDT